MTTDSNSSTTVQSTPTPSALDIPQLLKDTDFEGMGKDVSLSALSEDEAKQRAEEEGGKYFVKDRFFWKTVDLCLPVRDTDGEHQTVFEACLHAGSKVKFKKNSDCSSKASSCAAIVNDNWGASGADNPAFTETSDRHFSPAKIGGTIGGLIFLIGSAILAERTYRSCKSRRSDDSYVEREANEANNETELGRGYGV